MIQWILLLILVEAITELATTASIFSKPRDYLSQKSGFFAELIGCGYCFSVWVSASVAWMLPSMIDHYFLLNYFVNLFVLHRGSNLIHELFSKWFGRSPITIVLHKHETVSIEGQTNGNYEESGS